MCCRNKPGEGALVPHAEKYAQNIFQQLKLLLMRQLMLFLRDPVLVQARMLQCLVMALIIGGLWFRLGTSFEATRCVAAFCCSLVDCDTAQSFPTTIQSFKAASSSREARHIACHACVA